MPTLHGSVDRRIVMNYRAEKEGLDDVLPDPLTAVEVENGDGIAQAEVMRHRVSLLRSVPKPLRLPAQTASHRIGVEWDDGKRGMYVLRRDTNSGLGQLAGATLPIMRHGRARFQNREFGDRGEYSVQMDGEGAFVKIDAHEAESVNGSVFGSTREAERFQRAEETSVEISDKGFVNSRLSVTGGLRPLETVDARSTVLEEFDGAEFDSAFVGTGDFYEWQMDDDRVTPEQF